MDRWQLQAACRDTDPSVFYSEDVEAAKAICQDCPVQPECLNHALTSPEKHGVWGGKSEKERDRMRPRRTFNPSPRYCALCGTKFTPRAINARYCHEKCRNKANDRDRRNRDPERNRERMRQRRHLNIERDLEVVTIEQRQVREALRH